MPSRRLRLGRSRAILLFLLAGSAFGQLTARADDTLLEGRVTYLSGDVAYVDLGRDDGLVEGDSLSVIRADEAVGVLIAEYVSSHRAACRISVSTTPFQVGEVVRITVVKGTGPEPAGPREPEAVAPARAGDVGRRGGGLEGAGVSGRVRFRFLAVDDKTGSNNDYGRPALDVSLGGEGIGGSGWGIDVRVRSQRTFRTADDGRRISESRTRMYRLSGRWQGGGSPFRVSFGRQVSSDLVGVSTFDGVLGQYERSKWALGLFSGTQPDRVDFGPSTEIREHGGFLRYQGGTGTSPRWTVIGGLVGSYGAGDIDREYGFLQINHSADRTRAVVSHQADLNRGWKRDAGEKSVAVTNVYGHVHHRLQESVTLEAGFDDRRNVRTYRYKETPETQFDDSSRRGVWGGIGKAFGRSYRINVRGRTSSAPSTGGNHSINALVSAYWPRLSSLRMRLRSTVYRNARTEGWLHSLSAGAHLGSRTDLELTVGAKIEDGRTAGAEDERLLWTEMSLDHRLGRQLFLDLTAEANKSGVEDYRLYYAGVGWRF